MNTKEEQYRKIAWDLVSYIEELNSEEDLCDCGFIEDEEGSDSCHAKDCKAILINKDIEMFENKIREVSIIK